MDRITKKSNKRFGGFEILDQFVDQLPIVDVGLGQANQSEVILAFQILNQRMPRIVAARVPLEAISMQLER